MSFAYLSTVVCYRREVGRDQALLIEKGKDMEETRREVLADYFAEEWLMVTENTQEQHDLVMEYARESESMVELSDKLRDEWETLASQITALVEEKMSETASLYVAQLLQGWGSYPFDKIARHYMNEKVNA